MMFCKLCETSSVNGVLIHESGCPIENKFTYQSVGEDRYRVVCQDCGEVTTCEGKEEVRDWTDYHGYYNDTCSEDYEES